MRDFDGDGKDDAAIFRPVNGIWSWTASSDGAAHIEQFGADGDVPATGDFNGDGKTDIAVFRPATGVWFVLEARIMLSINADSSVAAALRRQHTFERLF